MNLSPHSGPTPQGCPMCEHLRAIVVEGAKPRRLSVESVTPHDGETGATAPMGSWFRDTPETRRMLGEESNALEGREAVSLTEFLLARIAEDEARPLYRDYDGVGHVPPRVLAECAAKREILALHRRYVEGGANYDACYICGDPHPCATLHSLASVYSDHPDYREGWKT